MTLYGTGMRRSELAHRKVSDIDSQRMIIRVDAQLPSSPEGLADKFRELRKERCLKDVEQRLEPKQRRVKLDRKAILEKTGGRCGRCRICGGNIVPGSYWEADHVFLSSRGGPSNIENYLPAHGLCNTAKWDQSGEELRWVSKIGTCAKKQMEFHYPVRGISAQCKKNEGGPMSDRSPTLHRS